MKWEYIEEIGHRKLTSSQQVCCDVVQKTLSSASAVKVTAVAESTKEFVQETEIWMALLSQ